jgi:precorrin-6B methylase 2
MALELDYSNVHGHDSMLKDTVRCEAFRNAIFETVTPDSVVLDVGAGTGLLSLFAAQAGARTVYAVERTDIAELAKDIVAKNGFADRITVLHQDVEDINLPQQVDVIVSEWLGGYALDENLLPIVVQARDRWLKPAGKMIPQATASLIVPAYDSLHQQNIDFWNSYPYAIDLSPIGTVRSCLSYNAMHDLKQDRLCFAPQKMWEIDCQTCTIEDANRPFKAQLTFTAQRTGPINALAAWFDASLSDTVRLCNGPGEPDTHWGRCVFPLGQVVDVAKDAQVQVSFTHNPQGKGHSLASWEIVIDDYSFRSSDVTILT